MPRINFPQWAEILADAALPVELTWRALQGAT